VGAEVGTCAPSSLNCEATHNTSLAEVADGRAENVPSRTDAKETVLDAGRGYHAKAVIMECRIRSELSEDRREFAQYCEVRKVEEGEHIEDQLRRKEKQHLEALRVTRAKMKDGGSGQEPRSAQWFPYREQRVGN
jgi:hypothetical protein